MLLHNLEHFSLLLSLFLPSRQSKHIAFVRGLSGPLISQIEKMMSSKKDQLCEQLQSA